MNRHEEEIEAGERFEFGANWSRFVQRLDQSRIAGARESLAQMLGVKDLLGKRFLDAGSGSGLFSLAARYLGATVHSFDYDPQSVKCTLEVKTCHLPGDPLWQVEAGSVLDREYLRALGQFDVVYSWGVLHHTGSLIEAMENVGQLVVPGGLLFVALYNDQGWRSAYWSAVKRQYNSRPLLRPLLTAVHAPYLLGGRFAWRAMRGRLSQERGMSLWYDMVDWLGGWPFEVARPDEVVSFYATRGFKLLKQVTVGSRGGCNEFVFQLPRTS